MNKLLVTKTSRRGVLRTALGAALLILSLTTATVLATQSKPFPEHWGEPPAVQTRDYVIWPGGYGRGSSTVGRWIKENMAKDATGSAATPQVLYNVDFEQVEPGQLPDDFMVLNGDFAVTESDGERLMELPGAPIESSAVMFGPAGNENMEVSVRVLGTSKGRRYPAFGVGLNGLGGYRLKVVPAKKQLELWSGPEEGGDLVDSIPFPWTSGGWATLKLRIVNTGASEWQVKGKAWKDGKTEPTDWMVEYLETEKPLPGRPFITASPYSGAAIQFDDLQVSNAQP